VREHTLNCLLNLYNHHEGHDALTGFTETYRARMVEMCHDVELRCSKLALNLMNILVTRGMLVDEDITTLCYLIWADNQEVRQAASEFIISAQFANELPQGTSENTGYELEKGKDVESEKALYRIVKFFSEFGEGHMYRVELLVECFWKKTVAVRNWSAMCELLCRGSKQDATSLEPDERTALVHMLISSLKTAEANEEKKTN
jgi:hypothetical protein